LVKSVGGAKKSLVQGGFCTGILGSAPMGDNGEREQLMRAGLILSILATVGTVFISGCAQEEPSLRRVQTPTPMVSLVIDLQDGFSDDTVVIRVDGQEVFHKEGVNTDYSLGRADSVEIPVPEGCVNVEVTVPSRHLSGTIVLEVSATVYLGVSILDDRIDYRISDEMFLYF
jgi:hypothetical protein